MVDDVLELCAPAEISEPIKMSPMSILERNILNWGLEIVLKI